MALRLPPDAPPELVDALIAKVDAMGGAPAAVAGPSGNPFAAFLNRARGAFQRPEPPPDAGFIDRFLPGFRSLATPTLPEWTTNFVPERFQPAARAVRELTSPLSLATLPIGGVKGSMLGAGGYVGGAQVGSDIGGPTGELIGGIAGGIAAPLAPAAGRLAVRGGAKLATEMGQANVGNVMLPRAPARVARPLIYEDLAPIERRLYGIKGPRVRLSQDELTGARDYLYGPADAATGLRPGGVVSPEDTARIQAFEERYRGMSQLAQRRQEVAKVLAKYEPNALEKFRPPDVAGGPIAQQATAKV